MQIVMKVELLEHGISLDGIVLPWGTEREVCRSRLGQAFKASDTVYEMSEFIEGALPIKTFRDIYGSGAENSPYYFLNYTENTGLDSLELHQFGTVRLKDIVLEFEMDMDAVVERIYRLSQQAKMSAEGYLEFKELHLSIAASEAMGGEEGDERLAYLYFGRNVDHFD